MKQKKRNHGSDRKKYSGHIVALIALLLSFYFMYMHVDNYMSEKSEREVEQFVIYEKSAKKGLFGKPTYYLNVGHSPAKLYSTSTYKKTFRELDIGDVVEGYKNGDYFYTGKSVHVEALLFYSLLFIGSLYPIGYFMYYGFRFKGFEDLFNSFSSRVLKPLIIICSVLFVLIYTLPFLLNGIQKALPFGKVHTEAVVIDSEERALMSRNMLIGRYLTLAYSNHEGDLFYTEKEVAYDTYIAYRDAPGVKLPISYRVKNEYDLFVREITGSSIRYMVFDTRTFILMLIFLVCYLLIYIPLRPVWKEQVPNWSESLQIKKDFIIHSLFWKAGVVRHTLLMMYILACIVVMTLLVYLFTSNHSSFLNIFLLLNLTPVIWLIVGSVTMLVMRLFGSGLRNDLLNYTPKQEDKVIRRVAVPWIMGLVKIVSKIWLATYIPWFMTVLFSWGSFQEDLTRMQWGFLFLACIPMIILLSKMYLHLNDSVKNAPILMMTKEKLRCPHASYPWSDIIGFKRLAGGRLGVFVRKGKMEEYNVSTPTVYSLSQKEFAEDISSIYQELRNYKRNSSKKN